MRLLAPAVLAIAAGLGLAACGGGTPGQPEITGPDGGAGSDATSGGAGRDG